MRPSEVSGQRDIWYVYRDGVWRPNDDGPWWMSERSPRVVVSRDGWIEEANPPARAILGLGDADPLPRHFSDFVAPGAATDAEELLSVVASGHELAATTVIRPTSGELIACDLRVWTEDGRLIGAFRLADDISIEPIEGLAPPSQLAYQPANDVVFARYAEEALALMPEATPDGLMLRLRRLYPHARVDAQGDHWLVSRDAATVDDQGDEDDAGDRWWTADGLATVRYDEQGLILAANEPAKVLLGRDVVGRHWQDLVTAGTTDQVAAVLRLIKEAGWAVSRFRMPSSDGHLFEFDSYTEASGDGFMTIMRAPPTEARRAPG